MRTLVAGVTALLVVATVASCGRAPTSDYSDARARLDSDASQIWLPLEAFAMNSSELLEVEHANAIITTGCMAETGREFPRALQDWDALPQLPDRRYGLWAPDDAEANGYELPQASDSAEVQAIEDGLGEDWWTAAQSCFASDRLLPQLGVNSSPEQSPVDRGMSESYEALIASDVFEQVRDDWRRCIEAKGLSMHADARVLVPQFPPSGEQQLLVAAIDVECKQQLSSVQALADFEARLQLAYIDAHESELTAYRDEVDSVLARAREVLASGGE